MRRTTPRLAGLALVLSAGLVVAGCADQSTGGSSDPSESTGASETAAAELSIQPLTLVDAEGIEVEAGASDAPPADPAGDGSATCEGISIGMMGALTGANAALGANILNGAQMAVDEHNDANAGCQVELKQFDTEGDPQKATQVAPSVINDASVIGLVGPAFSGESDATGQAFSEANVLMLSPSATNVALTTNGWRNFVRGLGNDAFQGSASGGFLATTQGYTKVCVVEDDSSYGIGLAEEVTTALGDAADDSCSSNVKTGDKDFSATVQLISDAAPDAVFYAGYYAEAAPFISQLRSAGVEAAFMSGDGVLDPQFVAQAGSAAEGAYLTCPCGTTPEAFTEKFEAKYSAAPGVYAVEGYDLATIILAGIDSGITDRAALVDFVHAYSGDGYGKHYEWSETGELAVTVGSINQVG